MDLEHKKVALAIAYFYYQFGSTQPNWDVELPEIETFISFLYNPANNTRSTSLDSLKQSFNSIFGDKKISEIS